MSLQLFRVQGGVSDGNISYLSGAGAPGGDTSFQDNAAVGSYFSDTATGHTFKKTTAGAGADKWTNVSIAVSNISWREPVEVHVPVVTVLPTGTPGDAITLDGESITDGQHVLFSAMGGATGPNIYIYNQASGTFTEEANDESQGDTTYVIRGTDSGFTYTYTAAGTWARTNSTTLDEIGFIRAFIGKGSAGAILPTYTGENYITTGDSLAVAIDKIDIALKAADVKLGNAIGATGLAADGTLAAGSFTTTTYLQGATTFLQALQALDAQLASAEGDIIHIANNGVTTSTVVDSVSVDEESAAEWLVTVQASADPTKRQSFKVLATHNGDTVTDATAVDTTRFAILKMGANIAGLDYDVVLSGAGATQKMDLVVSSTDSINVRAARMAVHA